MQNDLNGVSQLPQPKSQGSKVGKSHASRKVGPAHKRLGALIRRRRRAQNMTMEDLGAALGLSLQTVQRYETGINRIDYVRMVALSDALGVTIAYWAGCLKDGDG